MHACHYVASMLVYRCEITRGMYAFIHVGIRHGRVILNLKGVTA